MAPKRFDPSAFAAKRKAALDNAERIKTERILAAKAAKSDFEKKNAAPKQELFLGQGAELNVGDPLGDSLPAATGGELGGHRSPARSPKAKRSVHTRAKSPDDEPDYDDDFEDIPPVKHAPQPRQPVATGVQRGGYQPQRKPAPQARLSTAAVAPAQLREQGPLTTPPSDRQPQQPSFASHQQQPSARGNNAGPSSGGAAAAYSAAPSYNSASQKGGTVNFTPRATSGAGYASATPPSKPSAARAGQQNRANGQDDENSSITEQLEDISQRLQMLSQTSSRPGEAQPRSKDPDNRPTTAAERPAGSEPVDARAVSLATRRTLRDGPLVPLFPWEVAEFRERRAGKAPAANLPAERPGIPSRASAQEQHTNGRGADNGSWGGPEPVRKAPSGDSVSSSIGSQDDRLQTAGSRQSALSLLKARNRRKSAGAGTPASRARPAVVKADSGPQKSGTPRSNAGQSTRGTMIAEPEETELWRNRPPTDRGANPRGGQIRRAPHDGDDARTVQGDSSGEERAQTSNASQFNPGNAPELPPGALDDPDAFAPPPDLVKCMRCGRSFAKERMDKHEVACAKAEASAKKRKVFNTQSQRVTGEAAKLMNYNDGYKSKKDKFEDKKTRGLKAKRDRAQFLAAIRAGTKRENDREGIDDGYSGAGGGADFGGPDPGMSQCRHCKRTFNEDALGRHETICERVFGGGPRGRGAGPTPRRGRGRGGPPKQGGSTRQNYDNDDDGGGGHTGSRGWETRQSGPDQSLERQESSRNFRGRRGRGRGR